MAVFLLFWGVPQTWAYQCSLYINASTYEWVDFSKFSQIWAKITSNLRKFWDNYSENLAPPWNRAEGYMNGSLFRWVMDPLSKSQQHISTVNQTWLECRQGFPFCTRHWMKHTTTRFTNKAPGGALTLKGGTGMSGSQDPFSRLSYRSLDPQLQYDSVWSSGKAQDSWSLDHQNVVSSSPATASVFVSLGKILNLNLLGWPERIWYLSVVGNITI